MSLQPSLKPETEKENVRTTSQSSQVTPLSFFLLSVFSIFQIVKFNNDACDAIDGTMGTCYTASECTANGGEERGNCASGFGVCCVGKSFSNPKPILCTDKLSDVSNPSELEQYSCLVGKVYWEDFNCFTMFQFLHVWSSVILVGNNSVQILNKTQTESCPSVQ